ncbi:uncharacterized protein LOC129876355 [Solanum dulcamara]|uniref:uncharacterized protein LOC129876355 n=1 Tax=Solanum dulcamara TaxID=45834 RepID=UPI0024863414|nr:uncharacterized protein LOC129876355 [Solanum dulcamara]
MVVALGPGKFYGSSLPRPRFYENPNGERVDPPVSVLDPFMSWAEEAHWSMGGLSFKRLRLQGRIEGNIKKLRAEREKIEKKSMGKKKSSSLLLPVHVSPSPPLGPLNLKRKMQLFDESDDENEEMGVEGKVEKRGLARKLDVDFDRVAEENGGVVMGRTRSGKKSEAVVEKVKKLKTKGRKLKKGVKGVEKKKIGSVTPRTSPRMLKRRLP